jgi:integrase
MISQTAVFNWLSSQAIEVPSRDAISWVLEHWQEVHDVSEAKVNSGMLLAINRKIKKISTGKRRLYNKALLGILNYLANYLQWSIPEKEKRVLQDAANKWFEEVRGQSANSLRLVDLHQKNVEQMVKKTFEVNSAMLAITLLLETAPVTLSAIFYLLTHANTLENVGGRATICYPISLEDKGEHRQYARYKLSTLSYRLLKDYFKVGNFPKNLKELRFNVKEYLSVAPFYMENVTDDQLLKMVTCHWQKRFPHFFVKDFINPSNQYALPPSRYVAINNSSLNKGEPKDKLLFNSIVSLNITPSAKDKWPHKKLLKAYRKIGRKAILQQIDSESPMNWTRDNILPQLYYLYVVELIKFGGVKKDNLAISTIETYTNGDSYLNQHPLSLDDAMSEVDLNEWAKAFYGNAESETVRLHLFYFLLFMAEQELTDALEIDAFKSPYLPQHVDANLVTVKELDDIIALLLDCESESNLQQLFCLATTILSFHGGLRRGEILRLRMCDIVLNEPEGSLFRITVANTSDGKTKSGKPRVVHAQLPAEQAKLIRFLLQTKKNAHYLDPLIGFADELISSRERQYILPVTRAIKSVCGLAARFHHLRHGGAHVLTNQVMALFTGVSDAFSCDSLSGLLEIEFVKKRFSYWLENRPIALINTVVALDEVANIIGHSSFDTTRKSYLHGHEWITVYFTPIALHYSKPMLRYLLGLNAGSNDLSRRINLILANDTDNNQSLSNNHAVLFSNRVNEMALKGARSLSWLNAPMSDDSGIHLAERWLVNAIQQTSDSFNLFTRYYLKPSKDNSLTWKELSQLKLLIYRNNCTFQYTKPIQKRIKTLLSSIDTGQYTFEVMLTRRGALHYKSVFELPEFSIFKCQFTLFKNKKTVAQNKEIFIEDQFFIGKEKLIVEPLLSGKSRVVVKLELKGFPINKLINLYQIIF